MEKEERAEKKKWTTPQLIVLVRGKPEEGVLLTCKTGGIRAAWQGGHNHCNTTALCGRCDDIRAS